MAAWVLFPAAYVASLGVEDALSDVGVDRPICPDMLGVFMIIMMFVIYEERKRVC